MDTVSHASSGALTGAAVAELMMPSSGTTLIAVGVVAGLIPDIDFLAELKGKVAAWTMHRIVAHNIPVALLLTSLFSLLAAWLFSLPWIIVFICCLAATGVHLLLDVLTSFGTCLFYPFSDARYTTRSHFIFDPIVIGFSVIGLLGSDAVFWIVIVFCYLLFGVVVRKLLQLWLTIHFTETTNGEIVHLEPRFLAPFRWMIIVKDGSGYRYAYQTLWMIGPWIVQEKYVSHVQHNLGLADVISACQSNELLKAVLVTFDMPLYSVVEEQGERYVLVEDLKWRLESSLRPLAFSARIELDHADNLLLTDVTQGGFFQSDREGLFKSAMLRNA